MKKVLIIDTGGTISQEMSEDGSLKPGIANIVTIVPKLEEIAKIEYSLITRIDSTDMTHNIRLKIVSKIKKRYMDFDGFVITHGTDTMADTACALNYMIQNLGKPIVLTGAQLPIFAPGPDGLNNLFYSVKAATMDIGEVVICFGDRILRGNRTLKDNVHGFNAFSSPRTQFVGDLGIDIKLNENRIKRNSSTPNFYQYKEVEIAIYTQLSGITTNMLKYFLSNKELKGVIIEGYGAGNIKESLIPYVEKLVNYGVKVVIVTTCLKGSTILGQYHTGLRAKLAGALPGKDLTLIAAAQKLIYALSREDRPFESLFYEPIGRDLE